MEPVEVDALLDALRTDRDRAMIQAMLLGVLRRCEVLGLRLEDLRLGECRVSVNDGKGGHRPVARFYRRLCCVESNPTARSRVRVSFGSDGVGEFGERGCDATAGTRVNAEFVVAAPNVLHQRMTADDHSRGVGADNRFGRAIGGVGSRRGGV